MKRTATNSTTPNMPTATVDFVNWNTCQGNATKVIIEPKKVTDWPIYRSRNSRESRTGVKSSVNHRRQRRALPGSDDASCSYSAGAVGSGVRCVDGWGV